MKEASDWPATALVFFPLIVTWVVDTAAMFGGKMFKGPKLAPKVSPGTDVWISPVASGHVCVRSGRASSGATR